MVCKFSDIAKAPTGKILQKDVVLKVEGPTYKVGNA